MLKSTEVYYDSDLNCCYAYTYDGTKFLFDKIDADLIKSRGWHMNVKGYVCGKEKRRERPLHKLLIKSDSGFDIDHINRNKMDCRRSNLRVCTHHENCINQSLRKTSTTGFIGVSFSKKSRKYESYIHHNGYKLCLGFFLSPQEAAIHRDAAASAIFGKYCYLNFPAEEVAWWTV